MKKLLSLLFVSCLAANADAQQWSTGLRLGMTNWMQLTDGDRSIKAGINRQNTSLHKAAFIRYEGKKHFSYEIGFGHDHLRQNDVVVAYPAGPQNAFQDLNFYGVNFNAQYQITCSHLQSCPVFKKLKTFVGVTVTPSFMHGTQKDPATSAREFPYLYNEIKLYQLWAGLNQTMVYNLCDHLNVISVFSFQMNTIFQKEFYWKDQPDSRLSFQLGAAYKF